MTATAEPPITKAISLDPRLAEAVAMWGQRIITYSGPPSGNMAVPDTDCVPGEPIDRGERIAIHSAGGVGRIIATAVVFDIAYISNAGEPVPPGQSNWATAIEIKTDCTLLHGFDIQPIAANSSWWTEEITGQGLLGNIVPGRWAWVLSRVEMLEQPVLCDEGDGVWLLPGEVAEQLAVPKGCRSNDLEEPQQITKAVTVNPQRAEALADGRQSIITQPCRPNGKTRSIGGWAESGPNLATRERFAVHSGGPDGALIATAVLANVVPINHGTRDMDGNPVKWRTMVDCSGKIGPLMLWDWTDDSPAGPFESGWLGDNISHELDNGTFRYGWWAWMLDDIRRLPTPIECGGHPGVWMIPDDIAAQLAEQPA